MNSCEQLGSSVPQPCLPQLLLVPGLGLRAFGASSGPRDVATLSGSGEALLAGGDFHPNDNNNQSPPPLSENQVSFPSCVLNPSQQLLRTLSLSLGQAGSPHFLILGPGEGARSSGTEQGWNRRQGQAQGRRAAWRRAPTWDGFSRLCRLHGWETRLPHTWGHFSSHIRSDPPNSLDLKSRAT